MFIFGVRDDIFSQPEDGGNDGAKLGKTHDYGDIYINQIMFFGDSTMARITDFDIIKDESDVITGRGGDMALDFNTSTAETNKQAADGKAQSIVDLVGNQKPQYLLITVGINNGVEHCSEQKFKQYYEKLITAVQAASPETKIILQSVFPVSKDVSRKNEARSNEKIDTANVWIEQLCNSLSLRYLNTSEILKDDKGNLKSEYDGGDGIHLNQKGYTDVIEYIKTHGYK